MLTAGQVTQVLRDAGFTIGNGQGSEQIALDPVDGGDIERAGLDARVILDKDIDVTTLPLPAICYGVDSAATAAQARTVLEAAGYHVTDISDEGGKNPDEVCWEVTRPARGPATYLVVPLSMSNHGEELMHTLAAIGRIPAAIGTDMADLSDPGVNFDPYNVYYPPSFRGRDDNPNVFHLRVPGGVVPIAYHGWADCAIDLDPVQAERLISTGEYAVYPVSAIDSPNT